MTPHYPDLGSASDWLKCEGISLQPIRSTTYMWVVMRHFARAQVATLQNVDCFLRLEGIRYADVDID